MNQKQCGKERVTHNDETVKLNLLQLIFFNIHIHS
jgi:hypothetical protein